MCCCACCHILSVCAALKVLVRWGVSKGLAVLLPPRSEAIRNDMAMLSQALPPDVVELLDTMEESMLTAWETNEETHGDEH